MANEYSVNSADLLAVANAIREKAESTDGLVFPAGFVEAISGIVSGGGISSAYYDISYGTFIPAVSSSDIEVTLNFELQSTDAFAYACFGVPIGSRSGGVNIASYGAYNITDAALNSPFGGHIYASATATKVSSNTSVNTYVPNYLNGTLFTIMGYGLWEFVAEYEYIWVVLRRKNI